MINGSLVIRYPRFAALNTELMKAERRLAAASEMVLYSNSSGIYLRNAYEIPWKHCPVLVCYSGCSLSKSIFFLYVTTSSRVSTEQTLQASVTRQYIEVRLCLSGT